VALLAVPVAILLAVAPRVLDEGSRVPIGAADAAAVSEPGSPPQIRRQPYVPEPDPDGPRGESGVARPASPHALSGYVWPLQNARLTLPFQHSHWGSRLVDGKLFHDGLDLATRCGDRVVAAHDGVVLAAGRRFDDYMGWQGDLGPYYRRLDKKDAWGSLPIAIVIDDGNGYRSIYAHFSKVVVSAGDRVKAGQLIGIEGRTGRASGCHLHYGLFSPIETAVFEISPAVVKHLRVPRHQTARIDPRLVLPKPTVAPPPRFPTERPRAAVPGAEPSSEPRR
jgi:murein DD-endopeptidase MepM/ murein hydrolase activator NlpD